MRKVRSGFSLIELLVVIAIIAILAAILFPIFLRARESARKTKCLSNCRQISQALTNYKADYEGGWPYCNYPTVDNVSWAHWMICLRRYSTNSQIWKCPATANGSRMQSLGYTYNERYNYRTDNQIKALFPAANYGVNEYLVFRLFSTSSYAPGGSFVKDSNLRYPSRTLMVADANDILINDFQDTVQITGPDGIGLPGGMMRMKYANSFPSKNGDVPAIYESGRLRHDGSNVVFADGHSQWIDSKAIYCGRDSNNAKRQWPPYRPECSSAGWQIAGRVTRTAFQPIQLDILLASCYNWIIHYIPNRCIDWPLEVPGNTNMVYPQPS